MFFAELSLAAQTAYAELAEQARNVELAGALSGLSGSFQKLVRKGRDYWYFAYRDLDQRVRMAYVGPDDERVRRLVDRFGRERNSAGLTAQARSAIALGCASTVPKHFRMVKRLADYGFFRAGGVLVGTHAFMAMGNMLGVRWTSGATTLDVDFAHAGRNVSVALPADLDINIHGALESLEMGLLPIAQFDGKVGAQNRNPKDPELRIDFLTSETRSGKPVLMPELNLALQPLKFMEYVLEGTTQACLLASAGAATANIPGPERYAVHKLIVYGERPARERTKAKKDLMQAASLAAYYASVGQGRSFKAAWKDALDRGRGWHRRAMEGKRALVDLYPELDRAELWGR